MHATDPAPTEPSPSRASSTTLHPAGADEFEVLLRETLERIKNVDSIDDLRQCVGKAHLEGSQGVVSSCRPDEASIAAYPELGNEASALGTEKLHWPDMAIYGDVRPYTPTPSNELQVLRQTLDHAVNTPLPRSRSTASNSAASWPPSSSKAKGKHPYPSVRSAEELWESISREKASKSSPQHHHSASPSTNSSRSPSATQFVNSTASTDAPRCPRTNSRFKEFFNADNAHTHLRKTASARRENPKLRLARLRREADSRSGSSTTSLRSALGAAWRSGGSTASLLSRAESETSGSGCGKARGDGDQQKKREGSFETLVGAHCANSARTGLPRWGC
jgi:hypothetical protein